MSDYISRQAAIMDAESWVAVDEYEKHLQKNVIEWLKEFPPAELGTNLAEVGTDLAQKTVKGYPIDADGLLEKVTDEYGIMARDRLYRIIRNMPKYKFPPADVVEVKHGEWISECEPHYECSECHHWFHLYQYMKYCPNCGAKMDGGKS